MATTNQQQQITDVTIGELARVIGRLDMQMQSVGAELARVASEVTRVASDVRVVRTQLEAHVERQAERTTARDREVASIRDEQRRIRDEQDDASRWRWTTTGKWVGLAAGAGLTSGGAVAAAIKLLGA